MGERVFARSSQVTKGEWQSHATEEVGKVNGDGTIEGTTYKFKRPVKGGIAMTRNSNLKRVDENTLKNPATGRVFKLTKKETGYFNHDSGIFVKPYLEG